MRKKKNKNIIIGLLCVMLVFMGIGYALISQNLTIKGIGNVKGKWDVHISDIKLLSKTGMAEDKSHTFNNLLAEFQTEVYAPGDSLEYEVTLINAGNIDAVINNVTAEITGSPTIKFNVSGIEKGDKLLSGATKAIIITITFDSDVTSLPSIKTSTLTVNIECVQGDQNVENEQLVVYQPIMKAHEESVSTSSYFLEGPLTRSEIESIKFTNTKDVPSTALGSFDVSTDSKKGIMAWYYDDDSDNLYELTIGQDGGVIGNSDMSSLFASLSNLTELDLEWLDTTNATSMARMFYGITNITELNLSNFNTSNVTDMGRMFYNLNSLTSLNISNFDTTNVKYMNSMFYNLSNLSSLDLSNFNTSNVELMNSMFYGLSNVTKLDLSNFNTSKVTDMNRMFYSNRSLVDIDLSSFDTSNVTDMSLMFIASSSLKRLDLKNFVTSKVQNMSSMFQRCSSLEYLNVSSFNTSRVTNMSRMFYGLSKITSLELTNFNTSEVLNMSNMFSESSLLTNLNLSSFATSKVTDMTRMFYKCSSLSNLDLSQASFGSVTANDAIFTSVPSNVTITINSASKDYILNLLPDANIIEV